MLPKLACNAIAVGQHMYAKSGGVEGGKKPTMESFRADFKKKYNADFKIYAPYAYDATPGLVNALVVAGSTDPAKYLSHWGKPARAPS